MNTPNSEPYDVLIVGAGPAGTATAMALKQANQKLNLLLVDKANFPRDKACGDAIGPGGIAVLEDLGINVDKLGGNRVNEAEVHGLGGISLSASLAETNAIVPAGMVIQRQILDNALLKESSRRGIEVMSGSRLVSLSQNGSLVQAEVINSASGEQKSLTAKLLVGADGSNSQVRKHSGIATGSGRDTAIAIRAYADLPKEHSSKIIISWIETLLPGYGWCFPLPDGKANVGCGMAVSDYKRTKPDLKAVLSDYMGFLTAQGIPCAGAERHSTYTLPCRTIPEFYSGRVVLVGDAAGMVNPLSGEGIYYALKAAWFLACSVADKLSGTDSDLTSGLVAYQQSFETEFGDHLKSCHLARKMMGSATMSKLILGAAAENPKIRRDGVNLMFGNGKLSASLVSKIVLAGRRKRKN